MADYVARIAREALASDRYLPVARPSMGGEDFAYYLQKVPGCFFLVGVEPPDANGYHPLHSDRYDFTDAAIGGGDEDVRGVGEELSGEVNGRSGEDFLRKGPKFRRGALRGLASSRCHLNREEASPS